MAQNRFEIFRKESHSLDPERSIERTHGCNGLQHAVHEYMTYLEDGEVVAVGASGTATTGMCDGGDCKKKLGVHFTHQTEEVQEPLHEPKKGVI